MKKPIGLLFATLATSALATGFSATAMADDEYRAHSVPQKEETVGLMSGAMIGAAAGGPPGAIVGAALGIFVGDGWITKREYRDMEADWVASQVQAQQAEAQVAQLEQEKQQALDELSRLRSAPPQVLPAFLNTAPDYSLFDNTAISIHFRTGSSTIESHYQDQLTSLIDLARQLPTAAIEITGYADRNGDTGANLRLSQSRTASVKEFVERLGIDDASISTIAHGESMPLHPNQSFETDFFDRRVIVRLTDTSQQMLTDSRED